jgi:hypothetical protein
VPQRKEDHLDVLQIAQSSTLHSSSAAPDRDSSPARNEDTPPASDCNSRLHPTLAASFYGSKREIKTLGSANSESKINIKGLQVHCHGTQHQNFSLRHGSASLLIPYIVTACTGQASSPSTSFMAQ